MAGPICKAWLAKLSDAGYALTREEMQALGEHDAARLTAVKARSLAFCESAWANEKWPNWGVEWYPDFEAHLRAVETQERSGWWLYVGRSSSLLGSPLGETGEYTPRPGDVCKLWMARPAPVVYTLAPGQIEDGVARSSALLAQLGGRRIVMCDARWANERYANWGLEVFPDIQAVQEYTRRVSEELNWLRYLDSWTILGTPEML